MNNTSNTSETSAARQGLKAKDIITLAIFSVLFVIICFIGIMLCSLMVVTQPFSIALAALLGSTVYMYMRAKVRTFGGILITGVILSLAMFLTGAGWIISMASLAGALIAELIGKASHYSYWGNTIGYIVLMTLYASSNIIPMYMMKEETLALAMSNSLDNAFMIELLNFITGPVMAVALVVVVVCSLIGSLLARSMLKKHFIKAGMV
ncbi:MAG: MptD family putative ECF transporter S component [Sporomusa sp.]